MKEEMLRQIRKLDAQTLCKEQLSAALRGCMEATGMENREMADRYEISVATFRRWKLGAVVPSLTMRQHLLEDLSALLQE